MFHPELLPPGGNQSVQELKKWWQRRAVPVTQEGIERYLTQIQKTNQEYLTENLGLSMATITGSARKDGNFGGMN